MALNQTLTGPGRLESGEDGEGQVQCERKRKSSLEKKAPSACKDTEAKKNADNEWWESRGSYVTHLGAALTMQ